MNLSRAAFIARCHAVLGDLSDAGLGPMPLFVWLCRLESLLARPADQSNRPAPHSWREATPLHFTNAELYEVAALEHNTERDVGGAPARVVIYATGRLGLYPPLGPEVRDDALRWLLLRYDTWCAAQGLDVERAQGLTEVDYG